MMLFQERQKDYDNLQSRIAEFEARERLQKMETQIIMGKPDEKVQESIDNYLQVLAKFYQFEGQIRLLKLKQESYQHSLARSRLLNFDEEEEEDTDKGRLLKFIFSLDRKMLRLRKKLDVVELSLKSLENEVPMNDPDFRQKVQNLKTEMQSDHSLKVNEFIFHDQAITEGLLRDTLTQVKKLYLKHYTDQDSDTKKAFQVFLNDTLYFYAP